MDVLEKRLQLNNMKKLTIVVFYNEERHYNEYYIK